MKINKLTKVMVDIMFYGGIVCVALVPFLAKLINASYGYEGVKMIAFTLMLFFSGVCAVYILFNLKQMYKTLIGGNPFVKKNTACLKRMAVACGIITLIYVIKCFWMFSWATVVIVIVFSVGSLFCLTLKNIFDTAIEYKQENDLTI